MRLHPGLLSWLRCTSRLIRFDLSEYKEKVHKNLCPRRSFASKIAIPLQKEYRVNAVLDNEENDVKMLKCSLTFSLKESHNCRYWAVDGFRPLEFRVRVSVNKLPKTNLAISITLDHKT